MMSGRYVWKVYDWRGEYVGTYGSYDAADREVSRNGGHWERVYDPGCNSDYTGCINSAHSPSSPTHFGSDAGDLKFSWEW